MCPIWSFHLHPRGRAHQRYPSGTMQEVPRGCRVGGRVTLSLGSSCAADIACEGPRAVLLCPLGTAEQLSSQGSVEWQPGIAAHPGEGSTHRWPWAACWLWITLQI